jgi:hypothetical protein
MSIIVFFVDYLTPGIDVVSQTKIPHIGGDLLFAAGLGLLNALIVPFLKMMHGGSLLRMVLATLILNFALYALLKVLSIGVFVTNLEGYLAAPLAVSIGSFLINHFHVKKHLGGYHSGHHHHHHHDS